MANSGQIVTHLNSIVSQEDLSLWPPCPPSLFIIPPFFFLCDAGSLPHRHSVYLLWLLSLWCGPRVPFKSVFNLEWKGGRQIESRERLTDGGEGTDRAGLPLFNMKYKENRIQGCPQVTNNFMTGNSTVYCNFFINIIFFLLSSITNSCTADFYFCRFQFITKTSRVFLKLPPHLTL